MYQTTILYFTVPFGTGRFEDMRRKDQLILWGAFLLWITDSSTRFHITSR